MGERLFSRKVLFVSLLFAFAFFAFAFADYIFSPPTPGHYAENIYININGNNITFQEAIDDKLLLGYNLIGGEVSNNFEQGHSGKEVIINISGNEKTVQDAINDGSLCSNLSSSTYSGFEPDLGHLGNQILVKNNSDFEKSLQQVIDDNEFCTCGNNICEDSNNVNNYGENSYLCPSDCLSEVKYCPQRYDDVRATNNPAYVIIRVAFQTSSPGNNVAGLYVPSQPSGYWSGSATRFCNLDGSWGPIVNNMQVN